MAQPLVVSKNNPSHIYSCGHTYADGIFCRPMHFLPNNPNDLLDLKSCSICSSIIRMDVLRKIGLLNECFKIYYESSDLSFRIRKVGYLCACNKDAIAYNEGTIVSTAGNYHEAYYRMRNGLVFWYMHNMDAFLKMKENCLKELEPLMKNYNDHEFCTDCVKESTRKGIIDGLALCEKHSQDELTIMSPKISEFNKSKLIVLCQGDEIHGS
jgi:GT2 family glycosyltransferase